MRKRWPRRGEMWRVKESGVRAGEHGEVHDVDYRQNHITLYFEKPSPEGYHLEGYYDWDLELANATVAGRQA